MKVERAGRGTDPEIYPGRMKADRLPMVLGHETVGTIEAAEKAMKKAVGAADEYPVRVIPKPF